MGQVDLVIQSLEHACGPWRGTPRAEPQSSAAVPRFRARGRRPARPDAARRAMTIGPVRAIAVAITLALCAASDSAGQAKISGSDLDRAQAAFEGGRYAEALALARRAANTAPASARAQMIRAGVAEFLGEFDEARTFYDRAIALTPDDAELLYRAASFTVRVGEYDRALTQLDRLLALHPTRVRWLFGSAPTSMQSTLLRDHPFLEHIVQTRIDILTEKGDLAQARRMARSYAIVKPGENYCVEAQAKSRAGAERDETFRAFRLAILAEPEAGDCISWYGQWLSDEGYVRLSRLLVGEGAHRTSPAGSKQSAARYIKVRLGGSREVSKRAEQLFIVARQRYLRDGD